MVEPTYGVLLAGGLARRMGGGDKPLRRIGGTSILERLIARLEPQTSGLLLNANGDPGRFGPLAVPVVSDGVPGFPGPLAGILAGLDWLATHRAEVGWAVSVAGDTPFIPANLVARLHRERARRDAQLACASSGGRMHPVIGLWPVGLRGDLRAFLVDEGLRKVHAFMARFRAAEVVWPTEPFDPFFNANAPEDLERAEAIAGRLAKAGS